MARDDQGAGFPHRPPAPDLHRRGPARLRSGRGSLTPASPPHHPGPAGRLPSPRLPRFRTERGVRGDLLARGVCPRACDPGRAGHVRTLRVPCAPAHVAAPARPCVAPRGVRDACPSVVRAPPGVRAGRRGALPYESEKRPAVDPPTGRQRGASHSRCGFPPRDPAGRSVGAEAPGFLGTAGPAGPALLLVPPTRAACGLPGYVRTGGPLKAPRCTCPGHACPERPPRPSVGCPPRHPLASHSKTREPTEWLPLKRCDLSLFVEIT